MDFLTTDKIFCLGQNFFVQDNLGFVLDKKYFVRAEGRGINVFGLPIRLKLFLARKASTISGPYR